MQNIDLSLCLNELCEVLGISKPPSIGWLKTKGRFDGVYNPGSHRIEISLSVSPEAVKTLIVHELCHAVLLRAGYRSTGHSSIFLATYHLMLVKAGLEGTDSMEGAAIVNWNKWTPWPHWYRHLINAQEIAGNLQSQDGFLEFSNAQTIARTVMDLRKYPKWIPLWIIYRWHEIIADTRGNWFAIWQMSRISFFIAIALILTPFIIVKKFGFILFGMSNIGLWVISKVFKLKSNVSGRKKYRVLSNLPSCLIKWPTL